MRILVCVKQVIDTAARIELKDQKLDGTALARVLNPYDEFAIEEALRIRELKHDTEIVLISLGPECFRDSLRAGLAMGADRAVHLMDPLFNKVDSLTTAYLLSLAATLLGFDIIFCGRQAVDDDMALVGPALAVYLKIPCVTVVTKLDFLQDWDVAVATRQIEGGSEAIESPIPALFTCQKGLNQPRLPSLKGIMAAKKKEIETFNADKLGFSLKENSSSKETLIHTGLSLPDRRGKGKIIGGSPNEVATQLVKILREQEKVV
ncbi:MAG TPA: electron transfer flavoprotein subunit beta/FixA family protein [Nitrospinaceae bacterium]|nr:electron transfer flavoprotein subunit beta/FixA family protein [Nitrospinaceae bacterium]